MRIRRLTVRLSMISIWVALLAGTATAQVKFDVKTPFTEKKTLSVSKAGVISYLQRSQWAQVVEFGEKYSLWLKDYHRTNNGSAVTIDLEVEIRTPITFGRGKFVTGRHVTATFDLSKLDTLLSDKERQVASDLEFTRVMNAIAVSLTATAAKELIEDKEGTVVKQAILIAGEDLGRTPMPDEIVECLVVGAKVMEALEEMRAGGEF